VQRPFRQLDSSALWREIMPRRRGANANLAATDQTRVAGRSGPERDV